MQDKVTESSFSFAPLPFAHYEEKDEGGNLNSAGYANFYRNLTAFLLTLSMWYTVGIGVSNAMQTASL